MTKKHEHTDCPTCGAGLYLEPELHCRECLLEAQAEEIGRLKEEISRLRKIIRLLGGDLL